MTDIQEETEPESSFKETDRNANRDKRGLPVTSMAKIHEIEAEDRDDDFSSESEDELSKATKSQNGLKDFTFIPGGE